MAARLKAASSSGAIARAVAALRSVSILTFVTTLLGGLLLFVAGWVLVVDDPYGGEPHLQVSIGTPQSDTGGEPTPTDDDTIRPSVSGADDGGGQSNPVTSQPGGSGQVIISDPLATNNDGDPDLLEASRHGALPRISPDGRRRPMTVYAGTPPETTPGQPRIALIVTGLGLSAAGTEAAIRRLPSGVTFAFAPYGRDIRRLGRLARTDGHELILQIPLEPYDYPDNDPGPHTLLSGLPERQNTDRLHWVMTRLQGYVGVMNHMGAKFLADAKAAEPALLELRNRGLLFLDDATSVQNKTDEIGERLGLAHLKADAVIDKVPTREAIDSVLARLIGVASDRGYAIGVASALPGTVSALDDWIKVLSKRNIALVPVSALVKPGPT